MPTSKESQSQGKGAHLKFVEEILKVMDVDQDQGLSDQEVKARRNRYGANILEEQERESICGN